MKAENFSEGACSGDQSTASDELRILRVRSAQQESEIKSLQSLLLSARSEVDELLEACKFQTGIVEVSEDGLRQIHHNSLSAASFKVEAKSGKLYTELGVSAEDCKLWISRFLLCRQEGKSMNFEGFSNTQNKYFSTTIRCLGGDSICTPRFVYVAQDITERVNRERAREEHALELAQLNKMSALGEMASEIAHEILNPVTIIKGSAHMLADHLKEIPETEKVFRLTHAIGESCDRIANIIKGLQDFSRTSTNDVAKSISILEVVRTIIPVCEHRFRKSGIKFVHHKISPLLKLNCNPVQLSQVILNLLNNAFDAVQHQAEKRVEVCAEEVDGQIRVRVSDSGPEISPEVQSKMFKPFYTTKEIGCGTGLGLGICRTIVEKHGGTINVVSSDSGTCFELSFSKE